MTYYSCYHDSVQLDWMQIQAIHHPYSPKASKVVFFVCLLVDWYDKINKNREVDSMFLTEPISIELISNGDFDYLSLLAIIIPSIISVIGFIVSIKSLSSNFRNELSKMKKEFILEKNIKLLEGILRIFPSKFNATLFPKDIAEFDKLITAYGSSSSCKLYADFKQRTFLKEKEEKDENMLSTFAVLSLLVTQIKYDTTEEIVSPLDFLKMRITDIA